MTEQKHWTIGTNKSCLQIPLGTIWSYRFLLAQLVRKDFVCFYRQTILGPLWFFIQPALTTMVFTFVFGKVAELPTEDAPPPLFYLAGIVIWNYFSDCFNKTSMVLRDHATVFSKVYFPRLIVPVSIIISNLMRFGIQLILFLILWMCYFFEGADIRVNAAVFLLPVLIVLMAFLGLGLGLIISSMTVKYRDLAFFTSFGLQLLMYATPVIYPLSSVPEDLKWMIISNPVSSIVETFRYGFLSTGDFNLYALGYSSLVIITTLLIGIVLFNKAERTFIDTL